MVRLRALPETPETFYLVELLASHDFQTALQNYLDLEELRKKLKTWERSFAAFADLIEKRRAYYEPVLPGVDHEFRGLDSRMRLRLEQHQILTRRLQELLVVPRPEFLATTEERLDSKRLEALERAVRRTGNNGTGELNERIERLKGVLTWTLRTQYDERLTQFDTHLRELQQSVDLLDAQYTSYVRVRQAADHSHEGYDGSLGRLSGRVTRAQVEVERLMARQGHMLESVAVRELQLRRDRLDNYANQARYALANSYDRATRAQTLGQR